MNNTDIRVTSTLTGKTGVLGEKVGFWHTLVTWEDGTETCEHLATLNREGQAGDLSPSADELVLAEAV